MRKTLFLLSGPGFLSVAVAVVLLFSACQGEVFDPGLNGNAYLQELSVRNANLIPSFSSSNYDYQMLAADLDRYVVLTRPYIFRSEVKVNGTRVRMDTNEWGIPIQTDITHAVSGTNMAIEVTAEDGLQRTYNVTLLGSEYQAGISSLSSPAGDVYPEFDDGLAPDYSVLGYENATNTFELVATNTSIDLQAVPKNANASLTIDGNSPDAANTVSGITLPADGAYTNIQITNISQNSAFTNIKTVRARYIAPDKNALLDSVSFSGGNMGYLPHFYYGHYDYDLTLDDVHAVNISIVKSHSGATVEVARVDYTGTGETNTTIVTSDSSSASVSVSDLAVEMADILQIRVSSADGTEHKTYNFEVTIFTKETYDFNGRIGDYIKLLRKRGEIKKDEGYQFSITGILTAVDVNEGGAYVIEDGGFGLYVWNFGKITDPETQGGDTSNIKVGQKIRLDFVEGKMWRGLPEATGGWDSTITILETNPAPLTYRDGTYYGWESELNASKMFRFRGHVVEDPDASGRGTFKYEGMPGQGYDFKMFGYSSSPASIPAVEYMKGGTEGTFWGPIYYDSTEGYTMMIERLRYMIVE